MDRAVRLTDLWRWLPVFRAVAETQHLPTAAGALHVSASALSRSVSLLEEAIGRPLFDRDGRRLRLNRDGETLLAATRDAMRRIDDGIAQITSSAADRIRVAAPAPWFELIVRPAVATLSGSAVELVDLQPGDLVAALMRGDVDVAVGTIPVEDERLLVDRLGTARRAVSGTTHGGDDRSFAVSGDDGWPAGVTRRIGMRASRPDAVIEACLSGQFVAVLPVALARRHRLRVRRTPAIPASEVFVSYRRPLDGATPDPTVAAIRTVARDILDA